MIRVALRGLLGRKLRAILTAVAIILGVAMMSGTFVLTDTIDKAFSTIFDESYAETDVVVSGKGADISFQGLEAEAPPIDESLVAEVNALPDVEIASGSVADETNTKIIGSDGKAINTEGAPSLGFGIDPSPEVQRFNPLNLVAGAWAEEHGHPPYTFRSGKGARALSSILCWWHTCQRRVRHRQPSSSKPGHRGAADEYDACRDICAWSR